MSAVRKHAPMPVSAYLAGELTSAVKHEYVGGSLYAMAGASLDHNRVASDVLTALNTQLRGRRCEAFNSDMKIRIQLPTHLRFYYPDVSVVCRPDPETDSFQDFPAVVVEVVSPDTRRIDEGEKKDHYLRVGSLTVYILLEQDATGAVVFRRTENGFKREDYEDQDAVIPLPEIHASLALSDAFRRVRPKAEP